MTPRSSYGFGSPSRDFPCIAIIAYTLNGRARQWLVGASSTDTEATLKAFLTDQLPAARFEWAALASWMPLLGDRTDLRIFPPTV